MLEPIWRARLRSLKPGVDHQEQVDHNFDDGIVGELERARVLFVRCVRQNACAGARMALD